MDWLISRFSKELKGGCRNLWIISGKFTVSYLRFRFSNCIQNFSLRPTSRVNTVIQYFIAYFRAKIDLKDEENKELSKKPFYKSCERIFKAFSLWLEEPRLQENNILLKSLPPQYEPGYLVHIMQGENVSKC